MLFICFLCSSCISIHTKLPGDSLDISRYETSATDVIMTKKKEGGEGRTTKAALHSCPFSLWVLLSIIQTKLSGCLCLHWDLQSFLKVCSLTCFVSLLIFLSNLRLPHSMIVCRVNSLWTGAVLFWKITVSIECVIWCGLQFGWFFGFFFFP